METSKSKRSKLLQLAADGRITDDEFISMSAECRKEIADLEQKIASLQEKLTNEKDLSARLKKIRKALQDVCNVPSPEALTPAIVDALIKRIDVTVVGEQIRLDIQLNDGTQTSASVPNAPAKRGRKAASAVLSVTEGSA